MTEDNKTIFKSNAGDRYFFSTLESTTKPSHPKIFRTKEVVVCLIVFGIFYAIGLITA